MVVPATTAFPVTLSAVPGVVVPIPTLPFEATAKSVVDALLTILNATVSESESFQTVSFAEGVEVPTPTRR